MAVVKRGTAAYYYVVGRAEGHVVKIYVGALSDQVVSILHRADQLSHAYQQGTREAAQQELDAYARLEPAIRLVAVKTSRLVWRQRDRRRRQHSDCHQQNASRKESNMRQPRDASTTEVQITRDDFEDVVARAAAGSDEAISDLRQVLRANPAIYQVLGDLSGHVQRCLVDLVAGGCVVAKEAIQLQAEELRRELLRDADSPLERLLADQIVTTWLDVNIQQIGLAQPHEKETHRQRWEQRFDRAQRRHLAAVTALAEVRGYRTADTATLFPQQIEERT
jgi:hypothetical protein